jgi:hypothetical protein
MDIPTKFLIPLRKKAFYYCDYDKAKGKCCKPSCSYKGKGQCDVTSNVNFAKQAYGVPVVNLVLLEGRM